jgi:hypothetical protein
MSSDALSPDRTRPGRPPRPAPAPYAKPGSILEYLPARCPGGGRTSARPSWRPGAATAALRDCLAGLAPHRAGIARGDLRPADVLLKRAGSGKLLDVGSAIQRRGQPTRPA